MLLDVTPLDNTLYSFPPPSPKLKILDKTLEREAWV